MLPQRSWVKRSMSVSALRKLLDECSGLSSVEVYCGLGGLLEFSRRIILRLKKNIPIT